MTDRTVYIEHYGWRVRFLTDFTCRHLFRALDALEEAGCHGDKLSEARESLEACVPDTGLAYTNPDIGISVVIAYRTTSLGQLLNTLTHETAHVRDHVAKAYGKDPTGEDMCYLQGYLMQEQESAVLRYIAEHNVQDNG